MYILSTTVLSDRERKCDTVCYITKGGIAIVGEGGLYLEMLLKIERNNRAQCKNAKSLCFSNVPKFSPICTATFSTCDMV